jgi:hypothetical protein
VSAKGSTEYLVTRESTGQRNFQHGVVAAEQPPGGLLEPQALYELLGSFPQEVAKGAMQLEPGRARAPRQVRERDIPVEVPTNFSQ